MKLSKKEEAAILDVYKTYFDSYIGGDIKTITSLLADDYTQIGSAEAEVFFNKKEAIQFLHQTIDQVAGKAEMRNRMLKVEQLNGHVLIIDLFDMYVLMEDEWTFYAKLRASTLMKKIKSEWKFVYQHSSMPDARAQGGDNLAIEKISAENQELREAVKRRTVELESKNRELEIETALERVRARAMAMNKSEELGEAAVLLYQELRNLGVNQFFSCGYVLVDEKNKKQHGWLTDGKGDFLDKLNLPLKGDSVLNPRYKSWKRKDPIFSQTVGGEEFKKHQAFVTAAMDSKEMEKVTFQLPDPTIFYCANFSHGYLHILSTNPLSKEEESILVKFTSVFQMTYRRFLDLQKAEDQAREAQIEVALERVRAQALAMHHSDELSEVAILIYKELKGIGFPEMFQSGYIQIEEKNDLQRGWLSNFEGDKMESFTMPLTADAVLKERFKAWKRKDQLFYQKVGGSKLKKHMANVLRSLDSAEVAKIAKNQFSDPTHFYFAYLPEGTFCIISHSELTKVQEFLLTRFTKVFDQAYTRFLDLQKAEAQAKEAQIEAALERVRAASMAMHHSAELSETIVILFNQLNSLGIDIESSWVSLINKKENYIEIWPTHKGVRSKAVRTTPENGPNFENELNAWKENIPFIKIQMSKEAITKTLKDIFDIELKATKDQLTFHLLQIRHQLGFMGLGTWQEASEEEFSILQRFTQVFEQTYTRFLDLKKAEAQTREAQIEVALERIRAKALAMHDSEELMNVAQVMREQMGALGQSELIGSVVHLYPDNSKFFNSYYSFSPEQKRRKVVTGTTLFRKDATSLTRRWLKMYHSNTDEYTIKTSALEQKEWIKVRNREVPFFAKNKTGKQPSTAFYHGSDFSGGSLIMSSHEEPSQEAKDLQCRAAAVFDLAYRRFLDLQKAEAQTREAQIEAALERVRAKSMAMHKSEELKQVIDVIAQQFEVLDIPHDACFINIFGDKSNKDFNFWIATYADQIQVPFFNHPILTKLASARTNKEVFYTQDIKKKAKDRFFDYFYQNAKDIKVSKKRQNYIKKGTGWSTSVTLSKFASIHLTNYHSRIYSDEENRILQKIGIAFEQTYTRFLDLQKAEEQAREAQVEASLERVRAKAMAMHSSEDLIDTASQLFKEFQHLKISFIRCGVLKINESRMGEVYSYSLTKENEAVAVYGDLNLTGHELIDGVFEHWQLQKEYVHEMKGDAVKRYYRLVNKQLTIPKVQLQKSHFGYAFYFPEGCLNCFTNEKLPEETLQILRKFNSVMGMTYRRYFELKESEASTLATIKESSLDRVRAEIASMRTADDLNRITPLVWSELTTLGGAIFPMWRFYH